MLKRNSITKIAASAALTLGLIGSPLALTPATAQEAPGQQQQQQQQHQNQQQESWTGRVEKKQMQGGEVYVFTVGGKSYMLSPQDKAADFDGKTVTISGTMEGNTVTISDIKEA